MLCESTIIATTTDNQKYKHSARTVFSMASEGLPGLSMDGTRPVSRFQEGSMNDRASAAPPVQFLEPEELAKFEKQFYAEPAKSKTTQRVIRTGSLRRRERPLSACAHMQSVPYASLQIEDHQAKQQQEASKQPVHKKSGFLGRVRDVLSFGKGNKAATSKVQQEIEKRTSLQHPPTQPRPIPRMMKSQSQSDIPQLPTSSSFHGSNGKISDRPSRDEILHSYNQLMATGFFQAHAIQSTRQPAPGGLNARPSAPLSPIPSPERPSISNRPSFTLTPNSSADSSRAAAMASSLPPPPPVFGDREVKPRPSWESFRYPLRGRKRARAESDDNASESASFTQQASTVQSGLGRRVSKKLRKMPSAISSQLSDGVVRIVPAVNDGPSAQKTEKAIRMRSPSPAAPGMATGMRGRAGARPGPGPGPGVKSTNGKKLRKRADKSPARGKPPVSLRNPQNQACTLGRSLDNDNYWEPMDVDGGDRASLDRQRDLEKVGDLLREGQLGVAAEPLSVVPDANRGIPSVPRIPDHFKRGGCVWDENSGVELDVRFGEAL
ncbi:hypothetical protein BJ170DRAFT_605350 [Xylariales sp. AK1849]|nr:hypothetical protein BJ170DRAFT_605350 [Xylariales sp. AK1849]